LGEEKKIIDSRVRRERRKYSKTKKNTRVVEVLHQEENNKEQETDTRVVFQEENNKEKEEDYTEVFEESFLDDDNEHPFDIDNFNDE